MDQVAPVTLLSGTMCDIFSIVTTTVFGRNRKSVMASTRSPIRYRWFRAEAGYGWMPVKLAASSLIEGGKRVRLRSQGDWLLVEQDRSERNPVRRFYEPPQELFETFAKLGESMEEIKAFADMFGQLGFETGRGKLGFEDDAVSGINWHGEQLSSWQQAIAQMRDVVALWRALLKARDGETDELSLYVDWDPGWDGDRGRVSVFRNPRHKNAGAGWRSWFGDHTDGVFRTSVRGDLIRPAEEFLREELIQHLSSSISVGFDRSEANKKLVRWFGPKSLLDLMWLQFADALTGEVEFRPCKHCGRLIRISPDADGSRTHKLTCSDKCRVQRHQEHIRSAIALFDNGKTPQEIAVRSQADLLSVKRWITRELSKRGETVSLIAGRLNLKRREVRNLLEKTVRRPMLINDR
jgi:hypothetical protein